jgi:hypothetical protein
LNLGDGYRSAAGGAPQSGQRQRGRATSAGVVYETTTGDPV